MIFIRLPNRLENQASDSFYKLVLFQIQGTRMGEGSRECNIELGWRDDGSVGNSS